MRSWLSVSSLFAILVHTSSETDLAPQVRVQVTTLQGVRKSFLCVAAGCCGCRFLWFQGYANTFVLGGWWAIHAVVALIA